MRNENQPVGLSYASSKNEGSFVGIVINIVMFGHFAMCIAALFWGIAAESGWQFNLAKVSFNVLSFPLISLLLATELRLPGAMVTVIAVLNSLCWGLVAGGLFHLISRRKSKPQ